jgi:SAM-dependent methyltransferase
VAPIPITGRRSWRRYWSERTDPLHRDDSAEFYRLHAGELRLLIPRPSSRVLELGCGNGALFELLGFDKADYTGVDFSPAMLDAFRDRHPGARLVLAEGEGYRESAQYDLIFSSALVQYLDERRFARLIANARTMLTPTGCMVAASIPCRALRLRYYTGVLSGRRANRLRSAYRIAAGLARDGIGNWYSFDQVVRLGEQQGLHSELFGSMCYPYRFHVRMTPVAAE